MSPYYSEDGITIYHGDCREFEWPSVPMIWTDPPYAVEFLDLYETLAQRAVEALQPGGHLFAQAGMLHLPGVFQRLSVDGLIYWWIVSIRHHPSGGVPSIHARQVLNLWKPTIWMRRVPAPPISPYVRDEVGGSVGRPNGSHPWAQHASGPISFISQLTAPGDLILDPFLGSGTTLRAAKDLGRRAIGIEVEERYCELAAQRLAQGVLHFPDQVGEPG